MAARLRIFCSLAILVSLLGADEGFTPLFNGKSLDGWFVVNQMGPGFLVRDGVIVLLGHQSQAEFRNLRIRELAP